MILFSDPTDAMGVQKKRVGRKKKTTNKVTSLKSKKGSVTDRKKAVRSSGAKATRVLPKKVSKSTSKVSKTGKMSKNNQRRPASRKLTLQKPPSFDAQTSWILGWVAAAVLIIGGVWMAREPAPSSALPHGEVGKVLKDSLSKPLSHSFQRVKDWSMGDRVYYWSQYLSSNEGVRSFTKGLGAPPNRIRDIAPLIPEKFDCTTYVETVGALARSEWQDEFYRELVKIRYKGGDPSYVGRNHFPSADWIPNNKRAGILSDVTIRFAQESGVSYQVAKKEIDRSRWLSSQLRTKKVSRTIASVAENQWDQRVNVSVPYIPLKDVQKAVKNLPHGAVVNLVRKSNHNQHVLVSHQGLVVRINGETFFRHSNRKGNVRTLPLLTYLNKDHGSSWPVLGINVNRFEEPGLF